MIFIPAKDSDLFKLSCATRKTFSRTTKGARFVANERELIKNEIFSAQEKVKVGGEFINSRLVYVCKG